MLTILKACTNVLKNVFLIVFHFACAIFGVCGVCYTKMFTLQSFVILSFYYNMENGTKTKKTIQNILKLQSTGWQLCTYSSVICIIPAQTRFLNIWNVQKNLACLLVAISLNKLNSWMLSKPQTDTFSSPLLADISITHECYTLLGYPIRHLPHCEKALRIEQANQGVSDVPMGVAGVTDKNNYFMVFSLPSYLANILFQSIFYRQSRILTQLSGNLWKLFCL